MPSPCVKITFQSIDIHGIGQVAHFQQYAQVKLQKIDELLRIALQKIDELLRMVLQKTDELPQSYVVQEREIKEYPPAIDKEGCAKNKATASK